MTLVIERFLLSSEIIRELRSMKANFGFNGLGEVVFRRTYSRDNEDWGDVVIRVIQGVMSIRKDHFTKNRLDWDDDEWQPYARSMAISMFNMEWLPPGRGLWMMGTDFAYERGNMALTNCSATDTQGDLIHSAEWAMDCLMNGVGVGFTTYWRGNATPPNKEDREIFQIPDSREGWVESLIKMLCAYIPSRRYPPNKFPEFDYSKVRPAGEPIKGFGGLASGPAPLQKLHTRLEGYLDAFCKGRLQCSGKTWKELPKEDGEGTEWREVDVEVDKEYGHTRLITDIFNAIGACVVAGNVRRCLPGDALVYSKGGLIPIKDIEIGEEVLTMTGYERVSNKFVQGEQNILRIITQDGEFKCTPNHRMAVCISYDDYTWKEAKNLIKGDRLITNRHVLCGKITTLPEWEYISKSPICKNISPPHLDEDMAWFIGLFQGDGYTYPNYIKNGFNAYVSIVCGLEEYEVAVKASEQLKRFGSDLHVTLQKRNNENSYIVRCQSKQLAIYMDKYVKQANTIIRIPPYIMQACSNIKLAFVAGVCDADGCLTNRPICVLSTVYKEFATDIQQLLYSCGIESRYYEGKDDWPSREGWQKIYMVNLITKRSQSLFSEIPELHKNMRISSRSQNSNGFPVEFEETPKVKTKYGLYCNKQFNIDAYEREYGECSYTPVEIISLEECGITETYDIEVENKHEFFCNGYLTHNSAEICLGSVDDPDFIHLKNYKMHPERSEVGWMSNNSVVLGADQDYEDFTHIPDMARRIRDNGEPGLINLYNIQKYGRYGKEMPDTATLTNPCVTGDTWIMTACGSHQVRDLIGISYNAIVNGKSYECKTGFFSTGIKPVYKLTTSEGFMLRATLDHKLLTANGEWVELGELIEGDKLSIHDHNSLSLGTCDQYSNTDDFSKGWLLGSLFGDGTFDYGRNNRALLCYWGETRYEIVLDTM